MSITRDDDRMPKPSARSAILIIVLIATMAHYASSQTASMPGCAYNITGSNKTYLQGAGTSCTAYRFLANSSNNRVYCQPDSAEISSVTFMDNTYNNTLINCTFSNANIISMHNAQNNLISPYGKYYTNFSDDSSNIALGYYLTYVGRNPVGNLFYVGFITIVPYELVKLNGVTQFMSTVMTSAQIISIANFFGYKLPRFGYYQPANSTSGIYTVPLESMQISKTGNISYNPYWLICPYWGQDSLTFKTFTINSNMNYTPMLLYPDMREDVFIPDNTTIYWNFTVVRYNNATNVTAYIIKGWQFDPQNNTIVYEQHNITSGKISYKVGVQKPGTYEFIGELVSPETHEFDNSTTETYSVGISYCETYYVVNQSGYYTMTYNNLTAINVFWRTNSICALPLIIRTQNATINCRGGTINSTNTSILIQESTGITIENCKVYGNAIRIYNSTNVTVRNSTITANSWINPILQYYNIHDVSFINDRIVGYSEYNINNLNIVHLSNTTFYNGTALLPAIAGTASVPGAQAGQYPATSLNVLYIYLELLTIFFLLAFVIFVTLRYVATAENN